MKPVLFKWSLFVLAVWLTACGGSTSSNVPTPPVIQALPAPVLSSPFKSSNALNDHAAGWVMDIRYTGSVVAKAHSQLLRDGSTVPLAEFTLIKGTTAMTIWLDETGEYSFQIYLSDPTGEYANSPWSNVLETTAEIDNGSGDIALTDPSLPSHSGLTVWIVDKDGNPLADVSAWLNAEFQVSDAEGKIIFLLDDQPTSEFMLTTWQDGRQVDVRAIQWQAPEPGKSRAQSEVVTLHQGNSPSPEELLVAHNLTDVNGDAQIPILPWNGMAKVHLPDAPTGTDVHILTCGEDTILMAVVLPDGRWTVIQIDRKGGDHTASAFDLDDWISLIIDENDATFWITGIPEWLNVLAGQGEHRPIVFVPDDPAMANRLADSFSGWWFNSVSIGPEQLGQNVHQVLTNPDLVGDLYPLDWVNLRVRAIAAHADMYDPGQAWAILLIDFGQVFPGIGDLLGAAIVVDPIEPWSFSFALPGGYNVAKGGTAHAPLEYLFILDGEGEINQTVSNYRDNRGIAFTISPESICAGEVANTGIDFWGRSVGEAVVDLTYHAADIYKLPVPDRTFTRAITVQDLTGPGFGITGPDTLEPGEVGTFNVTPDPGRPAWDRINFTFSPDGLNVTVQDDKFTCAFADDDAGTQTLTVTVYWVDGNTTSKTFVFQVGGSSPGNLTISAVYPTNGKAGHESTLTGVVEGGIPPYAWDWNLGGGATPNTSAESQPTVMLGNAGTYSASVTVTDSASPAHYTTFPFTLTVNSGDTSSAHYVGTGTTFTAEISGYVHFQFMDNVFWDNSGSWNFTIDSRPVSLNAVDDNWQNTGIHVNAGELIHIVWVGGDVRVSNGQPYPTPPEGEKATWGVQDDFGQFWAHTTAAQIF